MRIGITEILVILVIVLVVFGGGKLAGVGKALGQSIRDFKRKSKPTTSPPRRKRTRAGTPNNLL